MELDDNTLFEPSLSEVRKPVKLPKSLRPYNLYHLLGLETFAEARSIKRAYHRIALKYHPDRILSSGEAGQKFLRCTEAYGILGDEKKRAAYDRMRGRRVPYNGPFQSRELVWQRRKSSKRFYNQRSMVDHDFNRFVDECRSNFAVFLKNPRKIKVRPKVYTRGNMKTEEYEELVAEGQNGFQNFLKTLPRIKRQKF